MKQNDFFSSEELGISRDDAFFMKGFEQRLALIPAESETATWLDYLQIAGAALAGALILWSNGDLWSFGESRASEWAQALGFSGNLLWVMMGGIISMSFLYSSRILKFLQD